MSLFDFGIPEDGWTHLEFTTEQGTHFVSFSEQMDSLRSLAEGLRDCLKNGRGDAMFCINNPDQETGYEHWVMSQGAGLQQEIHLTIYSPACIRINTLTFDLGRFSRSLLSALQEHAEALQNPEQRFPFPTDEVMEIENWLLGHPLNAKKELKSA